LDGLKGTAAPTALKLNACRKLFAEARVACGIAIADLLGSIEEPPPHDAIYYIDVALAGDCTS
jgi:hypothetical protein